MFDILVNAAVNFAVDVAAIVVATYIYDRWFKK